ncbi:MAG: hypothetical protein M1812_000673 [Candelaria pacifica]|nr:MAG: hypothetical protein M1812_000673 [Candelaria pacifica]
MGEREPSILEYARFHRLARDHRALHPLSSSGMPTSSQNLMIDLGDPDDAPDVFLNPTSFENERLSFGKDEAMFLRSLMAEPDKPALFESSPLDHKRYQRRKLELPILKTDHELDVRNFGRRITPDFGSLNLPFEKVVEENDEGLTWPKSTYRLPKELLSNEEKGKLQYSRDAFLCLSMIIKDARTQDQDLYCMECTLGYRKKSMVEPVTPPLLPLSPAIAPFIPSSPVGRLELLSDPPSSTDQRMKDIEDKLMEQDRIGPLLLNQNGSQSSDTMLLDDDELGQIYSPLLDCRKSTSYSPPSRRVRYWDCKVEGPLTPPLTVAPQKSRTKSVSFPEVLQEIIPDLPPPIEKQSDELSSQADLDTFFQETIAPMAEIANSALEQEQLQEEDSTMRVEVPIMDFSLPTPPWEKYSKVTSREGSESEIEQKAQERLLLEIKEHHLHLKAHRWPGASRVERELLWIPFPLDLGRVALDEAIDDDEAVAIFVADLHQDDIIDSGALTWKPEGLRILRDDDDDSDEEELQRGVFKEEKDMISMVKKRKLEMQESNPDAAAQGEKPELGSKRKFAGTSLLGGTFSAFSHLDNFTDVRSGLSKQEKLTESPHFPSKAPEPTAKPATPAEESPRPAATEAYKPLKEPDRPPLPVPETHSPSMRHPFIISSTLLKQKTLTRRIRTLYPKAELIERDWTAHIPSPPQSTSKPIKTVAPEVLHDEADLLLSPSTGLILTTLQKLKQRPLPGQKQRSAIRDRIIRVAPRYERLVVFVSESRIVGGNGTAGMTGDDCEAVVEFMGFVAGLNDEVEVKYIAGGEEEFASWIVEYMIRYGGSEGELKLIQDETLVRIIFRPFAWELFLRRAGMNAFAAQVVLSELKAPDENQGKSEGQSEQADFGLTKFVKMGVSKRVRMFERLLGGKKVLLKESVREEYRAETPIGL